MMRTIPLVIFACAEATVQDDPVSKVTSLLTKLKEDLESEATEESKTYDAFACKCKELSNGKSEAITTGSANIDTLVAKLETAETTKEELIAAIAESSDTIATCESQLETAKNNWAKYVAQYNVEHADVNSAVISCENAIKALKKGGASFLQADAPALKRMLVVADAMGLNTKALNFLQSGEEPYENHSGDILSTIETLKKEFSDRKTAMEKDHTRSTEAKEKNVAALELEKGEAEKSLKEQKKRKSETELEIATDTDKTTTEQATLHDNEVFLKELTKSCEDKAALWDQRSKMRDDELEALSKAIEIVSGKVSPASSVIKRALLQEAPFSNYANVEPQPGQHEADMADAEELTANSEDSETAELALDEAENNDYQDDLQDTEADAAEGDSQADEDEAFIQVSLLSPRGSAIHWIRKAASYRSNPAIKNLLLQVGADPLAKIKDLIQELIHRLLEEHNAEIKQEGWCNTETGKAEKSRSFAWAQVQSFSAAVVKHTADVREYAQNIIDLKKEIVELNKDLKEATTQRKKEKEEYEQAIKTGQEGLKAVKSAYKLLREFYRDARNVQFIQQTPVQAELGDAGFDDKYRGNQARSSGVLGMLEVIITDFERSIKQNTDAEAKSYKDFTEMERATLASLSDRETAQGNAERDLDTSQSDLVEAHENVKAQQERLDLSIKTLEKLRPACVETGMTYEERKAAREAEIKALEKAKTQLTPKQTSGV